MFSGFRDLGASGGCVDGKPGGVILSLLSTKLRETMR